METMEAKIKQSRFTTDAGQQRAASYIRDLKEEVRKITWTTKSELIFCTKLVIGTTFVFGLGIYLVDLLVKGGLDTINAAIRFIFG
ncbi:MAG: preprotein translocase subunit SecE [Chlamydiota bacterium]